MYSSSRETAFTLTFRVDFPLYPLPCSFTSWGSNSKKQQHEITPFCSVPTWNKNHWKHESNYFRNRGFHFGGKCNEHFDTHQVPWLSFFLLRMQQKSERQGSSNKLKTWVLVKEKDYLLNKGSEQMNKTQLTLVINLHVLQVWWIGIAMDENYPPWN